MCWLHSVLIHSLALCLSEMTNDCLADLRMCCSSTVLQALELLVSKFKLFKAFHATTRYEFLFYKCCVTVTEPPFLFQVQCVSGKGEMPLSSVGLAVLPEDMYEKAEHLFASSNMSLKRHGDTLKTEIKHKLGNLHLVLCIAVRGLASLAPCEWAEGVTGTTVYES